MTTENYIQLIDIYDEQLARCDDLKGLAETCNREAHGVLLDRIAQRIRDAVYTVDLLANPSLFVVSAPVREAVEQTNRLLDTIEGALTSLDSLAVEGEEDEDEDEGDEDVEEDDD